MRQGDGHYMKLWDGDCETPCELCLENLFNFKIPGWVIFDVWKITV